MIQCIVTWMKLKGSMLENITQRKTSSDLPVKHMENKIREYLYQLIMNSRYWSKNENTVAGEIV